MPESPKYPKRLWLAGPAPYVAQETIIAPRGNKRLRFEDGALLVHDAEEEAIVRKALGGRVFEETPGFTEMHPRSGWRTTSQDAFNAHVHVVER